MSTYRASDPMRTEVRRMRRKDLDKLPALISVALAAEIAGFSRSAAYRAVEAGYFPAMRMGRRVWVVTAEFRRMLGL